MPCDAGAFRNSMVANYKKVAVDWANSYSPVIDVTNTVKKVCPKVTRALLTIYGDDLSKIKVVKVGTACPVLFPDGRPADISIYSERAIWNILHNWLAGYEFERQKCADTGEWYWVIYPCKLEIQGTLQLPCTLSDFVGEDEVIDVTDTASQYFVDKIDKATLKVYKSKPLAIVGIYDNVPDRYPDGRPADKQKYGTDAVINIVENWLRGQEWERIKCQRTGKWYWVVYPCDLKIEGEATRKGKKELRVTIDPLQPKLGQTVKVSWSYKSTWNETFKFEFDFILHKPNGTSERVHNESRYIRPGQTVSGEFTFTVPKDLPGKYVLEAVDYIWYEGKKDDEDRVRIEWIIPGTEEPTVYDFVNSLVSHYGSKTPVIDVSSTLEHSLPDDPKHGPPKEYLDRRLEMPDGTRIYMTYMDNYYRGDAKLKLYLDKPEEIEIIEYGYDMPPKRYTWVGDFVDNVVYGWIKGYEMVRMYSQKSGKWYWIKVPAEFSYKAKGITPILKVNSDGTVTYGWENDLEAYIDFVTLFVDGKKHDRIGEISRDEWKQRDWKITKTVKLPPLSRGYHTLTMVIHDDLDEDGYYAMSKQIYVIAPTIGWEVSVDKPTAVAGDTLKIRAKVNWKADRSLKFKLGIDAFGKHYESKEVTATTSPTIIEAPITVPQDVKEGKYDIKVTLYYE